MLNIPDDEGTAPQTAGGQPLVDRLRGWSQRWRSWLVLLALAVLNAGLLLWLDGDLTIRGVAPRGIVSFECARTQTVSSAILTAWQSKPGAIRAAHASLLLDLPFLFLYSTVLALACLWFALRDWSPLPSFFARWIRRIGLFVGLAQWMAGLLDLVENAALWLQLLDGASGGLAALAWGTAWFKFALIRAGFIFLTLGLTTLVVVVQKRGFPLLQYIYFIRFSLLLAFAFVALGPLAMLAAPTLLGNLFALTQRELALVTLLTILGAWTVLLTLELTLRFAPVRFDVVVFPEALRKWLHRRRTRLAIALSLPLVFTAAWVSGHGVAASGLWIFLGLTAALVFLAIATWVQEKVERPRHAEELVFEVPFRQSARPDPRGLEPPWWRVRWLADWWAHLQSHIEGWLPGYFEEGHLAAAHVRASAFLCLSLGVYFVLYIPLRPDVAWLRAPALAYLIGVLIAVGWLLPGVAFFLDRFRIGVVVFLVAILVLTYSISRTDHYYVVIESGRPGGPVTPVDAFQLNDEQLGPDEPGPVVVVATSGGGIKAAYWTVLVLKELTEARDLGERFARSIRLISAVSGGSVGTMFYLNAYQDNGTPPLGDRLADALEHAGANSLDATAWGIAYSDLWRAFGFGFVADLSRHVDRGWALETAWKRLLIPRPACQENALSCWRKLVAAGKLPPVVLNATVVENGQQLLGTPFEVPEEWGAKGMLDAGVDLDVHVATAARLSATFPWITPIARADKGCPKNADGGPGTQPCIAEQHVADGGYYDNFGVVTATNWILTLLGDDDRRGQLEKRGIVLILIAASPEEQESSPCPGGWGCSETAPARGWLYATVGPLITLNKVRTSTQLHRNRLEVGLLEKAVGAQGVPIETFRFVLRRQAPLSWKLTEEEKSGIRNGWREDAENQHELTRLRKRFGEKPASVEPSEPP